MAKKKQPPPPAPPPTPEQLQALAGWAATAPVADEPDPFGKEYISAYTVNRARSLAAELAGRRCEALALYEPLVEQARFHASRVRYRLVRGSNRAGKTLSAAVEVARAVTGTDPHGKFPRSDGTFFAVGKDQKHLGQVMYRKLFRAGAFRMIRDEVTGAWRSYRPWADQEREAWARPAPPLIPPRMILETAWENKKENVPSVVRLTNGWEIHFFSSLGKAPQGSAIDGFWFDEEIVDPSWYPEMARGCVDKKGKGIWSATPQAGTDQLYELHERAEEERVRLEPTDRSIEEYVVLLEDNRHIGETEKRDFARDLTEEERRVRIEGEYAITSFKVYPTFNMLLHGYPLGDVPSDWTRYAYVDPGHRVCAVLFAAVPPPGKGDFVLLYDELYLREVTAASFAKAMRAACEGRVMQAFLMDGRMAVQTELGIGKTVLQQYSEALAAEKVKSESTGSSFLLTSGDVEAGILAVQGLLRVRDDGTPRLRVMHQKCPNFEYEIKRYHRKRVAGVVTNAPDQRKANHLMDDLRYMALHEPRFVPRRNDGQTATSAAVRAVRAKEKKRREAEGGRFVTLGPGGGKW